MATNPSQPDTATVDDLPGFRFHPTDEELVSFYLRRKVHNKPLAIELIKQLNIYQYNPWDLPRKLINIIHKFINTTFTYEFFFNARICMQMRVIRRGRKIKNVTIFASVRGSIRTV